MLARGIVVPARYVQPAIRITAEQAMQVVVLFPQLRHADLWLSAFEKHMYSNILGLHVTMCLDGCSSLPHSESECNDLAISSRTTSLAKMT